MPDLKPFPASYVLNQVTPMRIRLLLLLLLPVLAWTMPALAGEGGAGDGSMRMFRDPETGAVGRPSSAPRRAAEPAEAADVTPEAPLAEEAVRTKPGGVKVNLRGRHRPAVVRQAGGGAALHECVDGGAARE